MSSQSRARRVGSAARVAIESLEGRQLMAAQVLSVSSPLALTAGADGPATVTSVSGSSIQLGRGALVFNAVRGKTSGVARLTVTNTGAAPLTVTGLSLGGGEPGNFLVTANGGLPGTLAAGASTTVSVVYKAPAAATLGVHTATLTVNSNDASAPSIVVALRGLATVGTGGQNEPSLQRLYDLYQLGVATGDKNAADTNLFSPSAPLGASDEVTIQQLAKAGAGAVTIQALGTFAGGSPAVRFGWYDAGSASAKHELLTVATGEAQSVNLNPTGASSFDPGSSAFGLYSSFPIFGNTAYSEDGLNAGEATAANQRKVRFYPLKNADGTVVPNAYVFTSEDYFNDPNGAYDTNDFFGVIRNVRPAAASTGLTVQNLDGAPFADRLVFNRISIQPPESQVNTNTGETYLPPPNVVHDQSSVRLTNNTAAAVTITGLSLSNSAAWKIVSGPAAGTVLLPGQSAVVTLKFVATKAPATTSNETIDLSGRAKSFNGTYAGTLTVNTNSAATTKVVQLAGYFQLKNEKDQEPNLSTIVNKIYGYGTQILAPGQALANGGRATAVGEEVLSGYWVRADASASVSVRQLAAYHTQGDTGTVSWFSKATGVLKTLVTHNGVDAQSLLPRNTANGAGGATFAPDGAFGLKVANESSDDAKNKQEQAGGGYGHHMRFFPARDRSGALIPDTYIMSMDYLGINYDFQDNVYLISNVKPANGATPNPTTGPTLAGLQLMDATTDTAISAFTSGTTIDLSGGRQYTVKANPGTGTLGSVVFAVDGVVVRTETTPPYTIAGDASATDHNPWAVPTGTHTMTVTPYSGPNGTGTPGTTITATFTATGGTTTPTTAGVTSLTLVNAATNQDVGPLADGAVIDFSGGKQWNVRANVAGTTKSVVFKLDGATVRTESTAPFSIAGDDNPVAGTNQSDYLPWTVANGTHVLSAAGFSATGGTGTAGTAVTLNITVTGVGTTVPPTTTAGTFTGVNVNGATGSTTAGGAGVWTVKGSGYGINGVKDQIHYAQQARTGDFDVKAKLTSLTGGAAGLVARGDVSGGNSEVAILFNAGTVSFGSRATFGAAYTSKAVGTGTAGNLWLRMKRVGSTFTVYFGTDGTTWTTAGSVTVSALPAGLKFGFVAMSGNSTQAVARFENAAG